MERRSESEKRRGHLFMRSWVLPAAIIALVAVHGIVLQYIMLRSALSTAAVAGVIVVVVIRHVGLLGPAYARLRRYFWRNRR